MAQLHSFTVPDFHLPFGNSKHPQAARANTEATSWVLRHELVTHAAEEFSGIGCGHLAGRVSGDVPYDRILLLAEWMAWSFVLDDQHDHLIRTGQVAAWRPVIGAITEYLETGKAGDASARQNPWWPGSWTCATGYWPGCRRAPRPATAPMSRSCWARWTRRPEIAGRPSGPRSRTTS